MLDYKFIKDNLDAVKQNIINRNMTADADKVVELFDKRTALVTKLQGLQQKRNENAQAMKQKLDNDKRQELIAAGKSITSITVCSMCWAYLALRASRIISPLGSGFPSKGGVFF